jgi:hypothetical protein
MNDSVEAALATDRVVDITTIGRRTGTAHRIEIWLFQVDGELFISGRPGKRGWYANLIANPRFTLHLKQSTHADLPARASAVTDPVHRRRVLESIAHEFSVDFDHLVAASPLVSVVLDAP